MSETDRDKYSDEEGCVYLRATPAERSAGRRRLQFHSRSSNAKRSTVPAAASSSGRRRPSSATSPPPPSVLLKYTRDTQKHKHKRNSRSQ